MPALHTWIKQPDIGVSEDGSQIIGLPLRMGYYIIFQIHCVKIMEVQSYVFYNKITNKKQNYKK